MLVTKAIGASQRNSNEIAPNPNIMEDAEGKIGDIIEYSASKSNRFA